MITCHMIQRIKYFKKSSIKNMTLLMVYGMTKELDIFVRHFSSVHLGSSFTTSPLCFTPVLAIDVWVGDD